MQPLTAGDIVTVINALASGVALIIHAWRITRRAPPSETGPTAPAPPAVDSL